MSSSPLDIDAPFVGLALLTRLPTGLNGNIQCADRLPFSVPPVKTVLHGLGLLTQYPSPTRFRLGLGTD